MGTYSWNITYNIHKLSVYYWYSSKGKHGFV